MDPINFLPDDYLQKKTQRRLNYVYLGLLLVIFFGLVGSIGLLERKKSSIDKQIVTIEQQMTTTQTLLNKYESLQARRHQLLQKASLSSSLVAAVPQSLLLACLTNNLSDSTYVTHYEMVTRKVVPAAPVKTASTASTAKNKVASAKSKTGNSKGETADKTTESPAKLKTSVELSGHAATDYDVASFVGNLNQSQLFEKVYLHYVKEEKDTSGLRVFKISAQLNDDLHITPEILEQIKKQKASYSGKPMGLLNKLATSLKAIGQ